MPGSWADGRREAAAEQERLLQERRAAESARAQALIDAFVATAAQDAVAPEPLVVQGYRGGRARTGLQGWYLKADRSVGLDTDGRFYVLRADLTLRERLRGLTPRPLPPPLIVGEGGGDGETIDMAAALERHRR
ncbi:hypothetical protein [Litorihabitans aurantiacus]|uniref:Uncharacterized protein n=1 Tax=Litorihabitans aurantiacus TaxID=1930061 RepID=A0AA37XDR3_9MICO|nr:hypothetical protein [Litorihabitans aurantiacus]GMA30707.1 hypothetical protein GCM10025875_06990 [Litorihabitans aurantiacus]